MDPIFTFFSENIEIVTKEQLLEALKNALESAGHWREACLLWSLNPNRSDVIERM